MRASSSRYWTRRGQSRHSLILLHEGHDAILDDDSSVTENQRLALCVVNRDVRTSETPKHVRAWQAGDGSRVADAPSGTIDDHARHSRLNDPGPAEVPASASREDARTAREDARTVREDAGSSRGNHADVGRHDWPDRAVKPRPVLHSGRPDEDDLALMKYLAARHMMPGRYHYSEGRRRDERLNDRSDQVGRNRLVDGSRPQADDETAALRFGGQGQDDNYGYREDRERNLCLHRDTSG